MGAPMTVRILTGDCRSILKTLPSESVHAVVTSPPYWGMRDYNVAGQIGLEENPGEWLKSLMVVFTEMRRVLRSDGVFWLNVGDCYAHDGKWGGETGGKQAYLPDSNRKRVGREKRTTGLKPKDLVGLPWRLAFALQAAGWWLRSEVIWHKLNPMPENVWDRPTRSHEQLFMLTKSQHYFYDWEAIQEAVTGGAHARKPGPNSLARIDRVPTSKKAAVTPKSANPGEGIKANTSFHAATGDLVEFRNKRSVWPVASEPLRDGHYAAFPPGLIKPCIMAGCPAGGTVLDPFGGAGTTALVADRLKRNAILIELNPEYAAMARRRIEGDGGMFAQVAAE
jgi:DNA modification methylase